MQLDVIKQGNSSRDTPFDVPMLFSDETGEPTHGFKCVGINSQKYQTAQSEWQLSQFQKSARRGGDINVKARTGAEELQKTIKAHERYIIDACTVSAYGFKSEGTEVELSKELLDTLFTEYPTWQDKLIAEIRRERVFTAP